MAPTDEENDSGTQDGHVEIYDRIWCRECEAKVSGVDVVYDLQECVGDPGVPVASVGFSMENLNGLLMTE